MHKNLLTVGTVRAVAALHAKVFRVCRAATNEDFLFLIWCTMSYAQTARLCLSSWITHLLTAVPMRSRATFVELLCSPEGWVTRAICAITRRKHWTTYYKLLERGSLRTLRIAHALFEVASMALPPFHTLTLQHRRHTAKPPMTIGLHVG